MAHMIAFSQPGFDTAAWINAALAEKEDESLEAYLATLNLKIHVTAQEYTEQLEHHMQEVSNSSPRIVAEGKLPYIPCTTHH